MPGAVKMLVFRTRSAGTWSGMACAAVVAALFMLPPWNPGLADD
jgi:hypothetical protein